jgi:hypothetical protein
VDVRPNIVSIDDDVDGEDARVTVTLGWAERDWHGQAVGSASQRPRLAGEATLDAVTRFATNAPALELLALATTDLGSARVALAQVRYGPQEILVGSAIQGEVDDRLAAARAVMDAINRRLSAVL